MDIESEIFNHLKKFSAGPVLFVGSGISQRYLGTPTWRNLIESLSLVSGKPIQYYQSHVGDDPIKLAEAMTSNMRDKIWSDDEFEFLEAHKDELTGPSRVKTIRHQGHR